MTNRISKFAIFAAAIILALSSWSCSSQPRVEGAAGNPATGQTVVTSASRPPSAQEQPLNAQPGLWKIEATSGFLRVPIKHCLTASDMADPQRVAKVFGHPFNPVSTHQPDPGYHTMAEQSQQTCQYNEMNTTSDSLKYKYECKGAFDSTEDGSLKFDSPTQYSGVFNFTGDDKTSLHASSPTISTEGSRIGDCSESTF
ncbi:MAG TPA: DUF3617 family protein [Patescibacteria group bacterium]|nr:DUF3617 family protein [Patescibacteria group bacterium]